jgi:hypothetical protein
MHRWRDQPAVQKKEKDRELPESGFPHHILVIRFFLFISTTP